MAREAKSMCTNVTGNSKIRFLLMRRSSMIRHYLCILLALTSLLALTKAQVQRNGDDTSPGSCDQNKFFLCAINGACIPRQWLADGEDDCADGTDESEEIYAALQKTKPNKVERPVTKSKLSGTVDRDLFRDEQERDEDFFALTTETVTSSKKPPTNSTHCISEQADEARRCSADIQAWADEFHHEYSRSKYVSLFRDEKTLLRVERGCALLPAYLSCVDALPAACERHDPHAMSLIDWLSAQTYLCEFLVPSLREHYSCFGDVQINNCKIPTTPAKNESMVCMVVSTTLEDLNCVEKTANSKCDEQARELFLPLRSDTENLLVDLKCPPRVQLQDTTQDSTTIINLVAEKAEENESQVISNARQVHPATRKLARKPATGTTELPAVSTILSTSAISNKNVIDLSNALEALSNLELVCTPKRGVDLWAPIRAKICARREVFSKHKKCYENVLHQTESRCASQLKNSTTCNAIDAFNKNVDCVISVLTDACPTEIQELLVDVQEKLNDEAIAHKCYQQVTESSNTANISANMDGFTLSPKMQRCDEIQENTAVTCLVELIEVNQQLPHFASINFLAELSDSNSTVLNRICELYTRYENCIRVNVFKNSTKKCAFNSPLNTLARLGLSPICTPETRQLIIDSRECLLSISSEISAEHCQSGLQRLNGTVEMMLNGIHGEALLCKTFYLMRNSFDCGENVIREKCDSHFYNNIQQVKQKMSDIGVEEGCPIDEPLDLNEIIARPVSSTPMPFASRAPIASAPPLPSQSCETDAQKKFNECIRPLVAFKPHPLAVIKTPKDIDDACRAFKAFKQCRDTVDCNPIWARGMSAMFEYSCGDGYENYSKVKTCIRRVTTRMDIRDCVTVFSKSPPQEACRSANKLLSCALPHLSEKCGSDAMAFAREYVRRFTQTIDPSCQLTANDAHSGRPAINALNCSAEDKELAEKCAQPFEAVHTDLERLFQGGFQALLKNVNNIAPIFAQGCNFTSEFRKCARPVLERAEANETSCVLSSCFMRAGDGICDQPNVSEAIDTNLQCVFKQIAIPDFGKCMRSTIATIHQFTLEALRDILPKFVDCVEPIVLRACGSVPLNVLRALGSRNVCPVHDAGDNALTPSLTVVPTPAPVKCTVELLREFDSCMRPFMDKYSFMPVKLLNLANNTSVCSDFDTVTQCIEKNRICEKAGKGRAVRKLVAQICSNKHAFDQRVECLEKIVASKKGIECMRPYNEVIRESGNMRLLCSNLNATTECMAEKIFEECPPDSLPFVYDYTNIYLHDSTENTNESCELTAPTVFVQTGCPEEEFVNYLKCEAYIDKYHFQPISIIRDPSMWDKFCKTVEMDYRPCLNALTCKFEPTMSATLSLFENACNDSSELGRMQSSIAGCLGEVTKSKDECLKPFLAVDLLSRDVGGQICIVVNNLLECASATLYSKCGADALVHVYTLHEIWTRGYNASCTLRRPSSSMLTTPQPNEPLTSSTSSTTGNDIVDISKRTESNIITQVTEKETEFDEQESSDSKTTSSEKIKTPTTVATTLITEKLTTTQTTTDTPSTATVDIKMRDKTPSGNGAVRETFGSLISIALLFLYLSHFNFIVSSNSVLDNRILG